MRHLLLLLVVVGACKFDERQFGDRACKLDGDCLRPDLACIEGLCTQRPCTGTSTTTCGTAHDFTCDNGGCIVAECDAGQMCDPGFACNAEGFCASSFSVMSVASTGNTSVAITFDAAPDTATASDLANYRIDGLAISGTPTISGATVTLTTAPQAMRAYNAAVEKVVRAADQAPLAVPTGTFIGRNAFNVSSAVAQSAITVLVTFTEPPDPTLALNNANYSITGLALTGTPVLQGNTVRLTTSPQTMQPYNLTVTNVRRAGDQEPLTSGTAVFTGRNDFNVASATSVTSTSITVTFDAIPNAAQATNLANYTVMPSLTLSGTPVLAGNSVTITTSAQTTGTYVVTVANVTRASDAEPLMVDDANFLGRSPFNVVSASPATSTSVVVSFDAPPNPAQAEVLANYSIPGLVLSGLPVVSGNLVTLVTSPQTSSSYTVTVSNIQRMGDNENMATTMATFAGRPPFNVASAISTSNTTLAVTFDAQPNGGQANTASNYSIANLTVLGAVLAGNTVTLTTTSQGAMTYTVAVANVTRASDGEALSTAMQTFAGRAPFDVMAAAAPTSSSITVTFTHPPNVAQATNRANYDVPGLTLTGTPTLVGSTVTIATSGEQLAQMYTVTVTGVTRASDAEALTVSTASFTGRTKFKVASAQSANNVSMRVTFDAPPDPAQATNLANYSVPNLMLSGTPTLNGNTVTIQTSSQIGMQSYTVTVSNVTRNSDLEPLFVDSATFIGLQGFNVASAASNHTTSMSVTFDAPPEPGQATTLTNYAVPGLTLSGTPSLAGNTVTITTSTQTTNTYTVTVSNVTRAGDLSPLQNAAAPFSYTSFNVSGAQSLTNRSISVTFDAAPTMASATNLANYAVAPSLALMGTPTLSGNTVTITTASQTGSTTYTVTANNIIRASDTSVLANKTATFVGRSSFNVSGAASTSSGTMTVTFDAQPNAAQATTLANYSVPGLTLSGTPTLVGNTVTITTSIQSNVSYTVTVAGVTRASDAEPLGTSMRTFTGTALATPTVTNVQVQATVPDNGTTFFNTGTATVLVTGTDFANVSCVPGNIGVRLDDRNGANVLIETRATSCTVLSNTQISAVFPRGIRTNRAASPPGWNVRVTNSVGTNTTSSVKLDVRAGLLISEVLTKMGGGASDDHEFIEIYNPTANEIDVVNLGLALHLIHGGNDVAITTTYEPGAPNQRIKARGFMLFTTTQSSTDTWFSSRNATYDVNQGGLNGDECVYLSLSTAANAQVLDKLGWGSPPGSCFEASTTSNPGNAQSVQRKPAMGGGATTDTDNNSNDFYSPNTSITPKGTSGALEPP